MASVSVKINANSSEFQASMRAMTNSLREVDSQMSLASERARLFGSNTDILSSQVNMLSAKLEGQTAILAQQREYINVLSGDQVRLAEAQKTVGASLSKLNQERNEAVRKYGAESAEVKALDETILELNQEYSALGRSLDKTNSKMATATQRANTQEASMLRTTAALNEANAAYTTRHIDAFSNSMSKVSSGCGKVSSSLKPLSLGLVAIGGYAGYAGIKFEDSLGKLSTIADTGSVSMGQFKTQILNLSNQTGISANEITNSAYEAISAGIKTGDTMGFVSNATKLPKAGFTDTSNSIDVLTTIMNSYGLKASQANDISNVLIRTQNLGKTTVDQLSQTMGQVIPVAKESGVSLQQLASGYVELTQKGINTAESTTILKSLFAELSKSGSKSDQVLRQLTGQGFTGLINSGKSVSDVLNILNKYAVANGKSLKDMFGNVRAGTGALVIASNGGKDFNDILTQMNKKGNDTDIAYQKVSNTLGFKLHQSLIQAQNASIKLGDSLAPVITSVASGLSKISLWLSKLSPQQLKLITNVGLSIVAFTAFMGVTSKVTGALSTLGKGVSKTVGLFIKNSEGVSKFGQALSGISKITSVVGGALKGLWAILLDNPITLVIGVIAALVAGLVLAYNKVAWFRDMVNNAWSMITNIFNTFKNYLVSIFGPMWDSLVRNLKQPLTEFMNACQSLWSSITNIFNTFKNYISGIFKSSFGSAISSLKVPLQSLSSFIHSTISVIMNVFKILISFIGSNVVAGFRLAFSNIASVIKGALGVITSVINMIRGVLQGIVDFVTGVFTGNWSQAWNGIKEIFSSVWHGMVGIVTSVWDTIKSVVESGVNFIKSIINNIFGVFNKVTSMASNIGHKVASAIGFHVVLPNNSQNKRSAPTSFSAIQNPTMLSEMKRQPTSFASLQGLNDLANNLETTTISNFANGPLNIENDMDSVLDKLADKIGNKINSVLNNSNSKKDSNITVPVYLDGRQIATATKSYLNNMNGHDQLLEQRMKGRN